MYQGKFEPQRKPVRRRRRRNHKSIALLVSLVLLVTALVGGTVAWLTTNTEQVENTFTPSHVTCAVVETFTAGGTVKENVTIANTGDTDAYIRATYIVTWQDEQGNVYGTAPVAGQDYRVTLNLDSNTTPTGWKPGADGYYYYCSVVHPGETGNQTDVLIRECQVLKAAPAEGYTLHVEILAQAIQSSPITAGNQAWGLTQ